MDSEIILYQSEDGQTKVEVRMEGETVWLTLNQLAELFQKAKSTISEHIKNVFEENELPIGEATVRNFRTVQTEGERSVERDLEYYNLDVIISVGYRVKSHRGTQFRIWATNRLREYIIKGFTLDDERLKRAGQMNYFDELLARIRDIRSSEKVFYQKVKDIYATSIDYDANHAETLEFFKIIQNKLIWAVSQKTAAEIIAGRADAEKPNMGLTTWAGAKIRKSDVTVSKNYLNEDEITALNLLMGAVKRLKREGVNNLDLSNCYFASIDFKGFDLQNAILFRANLKDADLRNVNLKKADLREANLLGAYVDETFFSDLKEWEVIGFEDITDRFAIGGEGRIIGNSYLFKDEKLIVL